jgi:hypothetical protein
MRFGSAADFEIRNTRTLRYAIYQRLSQYISGGRERRGGGQNVKTPVFQEYAFRKCCGFRNNHTVTILCLNVHRTPSLNTGDQFSTTITNNKVQLTNSRKCNFDAFCKPPKFYNPPHIGLRTHTPSNCAGQKSLLRFHLFSTKKSFLTSNAP